MLRCSASTSVPYFRPTNANANAESLSRTPCRTPAATNNVRGVVGSSGGLGVGVPGGCVVVLLLLPGTRGQQHRFPHHFNPEPICTPSNTHRAASSVPHEHDLRLPHNVISHRRGLFSEVTVWSDTEQCSRQRQITVIVLSQRAAHAGGSRVQGSTRQQLSGIHQQPRLSTCSCLCSQ